MFTCRKDDLLYFFVSRYLRLVLNSALLFDKQLICEESSRPWRRPLFVCVKFPCCLNDSAREWEFPCRNRGSIFEFYGTFSFDVELWCSEIMILPIKIIPVCHKKFWLKTNKVSSFSPEFQKDWKIFSFVFDVSDYPNAGFIQVPVSRNDDFILIDKYARVFWNSDYD